MGVEILRKKGNNSLENLIKQFANSYEISVGFPKGSVNYPSKPTKRKQKPGHEYKPTSVIEAALRNEFGTNFIPERSFLRSTILQKEEEYRHRAADIVKKALQNKDYQIEKNVGLLGQLVEKDVKQKITDTYTPPNAEETKKRKGSEHPLIDSGLMRQSVRNIVKKI